MTKRFKAEVGYHGVHRIIDTVNHKTYEFYYTNIHDIEVITNLLNDVVK